MMLILMKMPYIGSYIGLLGPQLVKLVRRIRKCDFAGEGVALLAELCH